MAGVHHTTATLNFNTTTATNTTHYSSKPIANVSIRSSVKDCNFRVSGDRLNRFLKYVQSAQVKECSDLKKSEEDDVIESKRNYYVNVGYAIRSLRDEFPELFYREIRFGIYRDDIVFKDPLNTFAGIENYKSIFWALRFHGRIFFKALRVEIIRVWQPVDSVIMVRWTIHGIARVPWESHGRFDGTSEYKLDKNGKIYEHRVNNIAINSPPKFHVPVMEQLIQSISSPSTPKPTYFEDSPASVLDFDLLFIQLTPLRSFLASPLTSGSQNCEDHSGTPCT